MLLSVRFSIISKHSEAEITPLHSSSAEADAHHSLQVNKGNYQSESTISVALFKLSLEFFSNVTQDRFMIQSDSIPDSTHQLHT
jgi:hypothetical protein